MMICPKCNSEVEDNASYCRNCGVPFISQQAGENAETTVLTADMYPSYQSQFSQAAHFFENEAAQQSAPVYRQGGPVAQLRTDRSFIKTFLLSLITFGIYGIICYGHVTDDVNLVCSRYDGKKSMNYYLLLFIVGPISFGFAFIIWMHNICERIGNELKRRQINYDFGAKDFWLWSVLGSLIIVGPFVFAHKFFQAVNKMNDSFNQIG